MLDREWRKRNYALMLSAASQNRLSSASPPPTSWRRRASDTLFGLPLFLKVLIANCLVVILGVGLGTWFTLAYVARPGGGVRWEAIALMIVVGFSGTVAINAAVVWLALQPLHALQVAVDRAATGDLEARVRPVRFRDPDMNRLGETVNEMLVVLQRHRSQLQMLSEQVLAAQEDERKRISRELHDETAQSLTTLLVRLKMVEKARDPEELRAALLELRELTVQTIEAVRLLAVELRPTTLDNLGLVAALENYTDSYNARMPLQVEFRAHGFDDTGGRLPPQVELVLYRVVQEALTNAAKHSEARRVRVELRRDERRMLAVVQDDGQGFDVERTMQSRERGLGLFGMQERLALVGGRLDIQSEPGRGTVVRADVPLSPVQGLGADLEQALRRVA